MASINVDGKFVDVETLTEPQKAMLNVIMEFNNKASNLRFDLKNIEILVEAYSLEFKRSLTDGQLSAE